jgi:lipoate synthase
MILHCSYEELTALDAASERVLEGTGSGGVAAIADVLPDIEALAPRLTGDIAIDTLDEQASIQRAVEYLLANARGRTDAFILEEHPSAESAIRSYFEYAHMLAVLDRLRHMGDEMRALAELMTGRPHTDDAARRFAFED